MESQVLSCRGERRRRGYVSLSGLLTGLPPFMTTGSLVELLLGGATAGLGGALATSCSEGSRYIATAERHRGVRGVCVNVLKCNMEQ